MRTTRRVTVAQRRQWNLDLSSPSHAPLVPPSSRLRFNPGDALMLMAALRADPYTARHPDRRSLRHAHPREGRVTGVQDGALGRARSNLCQAALKIESSNPLPVSAGLEALNTTESPGGATQPRAAYPPMTRYSTRERGPAAAEPRVTQHSLNHGSIPASDVCSGHFGLQTWTPRRTDAHVPRKLVTLACPCVPVRWLWGNVVGRSSLRPASSNVTGSVTPEVEERSSYRTVTEIVSSSLEVR